MSRWHNPTQSPVLLAIHCGPGQHPDFPGDRSKTHIEHAIQPGESLEIPDEYDAAIRFPNPNGGPELYGLAPQLQKV